MPIYRNFLNRQLALTSRNGMDNPVDPQVFQTWKTAHLRAFQSMLDITRDNSTDKPRWEEERDNAIGLLEWGLTSALDEIKPADCPDFIDLVIEMTNLLVKDVLDISVKEQADSVALKFALLKDDIKKNELEIKDHWELEANRRSQAIRDAEKELNEVTLPALKQWEARVRNGEGPNREVEAEYLRIRTQLDELEKIFNTNGDELQELRTRFEDKEYQKRVEDSLENVMTVVKNIGNPPLNSDQLRGLLVAFTIKSLGWLESASEEATDVSGFAHFIVRVYFALATVWVRVVFFFKKFS